MRTFLTAAALLVIGVSLGGCNRGTGPASLAGECSAFTDPGFQVQGKWLKDKQWIGKTQEKGIEICGWKRPTGAGV